MAEPRCPTFPRRQACPCPPCSRACRSLSVGVIRGYKAVIDDERRGLAVNAYIAVTPIDYSQEAEIPDKLKNIDGIMSCDSVAGSPSFMLTVRVESPSKLEELLNLIHRTVSVSTETTIVLQRYFAK